jgi:hypothetical protein
MSFIHSFFFELHRHYDIRLQAILPYIIMAQNIVVAFFLVL